MNLETFFEKFDQFAEAPDAVAKMRELVLQLAVMGKLVTQDNRDEPALMLLESAEAERAKLVAAKKIKSRTTSPVESDEQPYELPSSWAWARLSDVGYELGQKVPDKRFTYIDVGGIDSNKGRISDRVEMLEPGDAPSRARKLVARGTVIYSTVRPYLLNVAIVDQDFDPEPIASTAFGILHPFAGINNRYLFYWLRSAPFTAYVQAGMKGMAYPAINDEKFYSGFIALPPLAEQKRIVVKVDELMALCDQLEAQQQERETRHAALARASLARFADAPTPANLHFLFHPSYAISPADLRKSILTLAVQGKLVPQDPNDEPAEDRAESHRSERNGERMPDSWALSSLNEVAEQIVDCPHSTPKWTSSGKICVRTNQFSPGLLDLSETKFVSEETFEDRIQRLRPQEDDILYSREGGILGIACRVPPNVELCLGQRIMLIRAGHSLAPAYLELVLNAPLISEIARRQTTGGAAPRVNVSTVKSYPIPLPPLAEQRRIVAKVEQLMALVDALESQLATSRATAEKLLAAVVAELTEGTRASPAC